MKKRLLFMLLVIVWIPRAHSIYAQDSLAIIEANEAYYAGMELFNHQEWDLAKKPFYTAGGIYEDLQIMELAIFCYSAVSFCNSRLQEYDEQLKNASHAVDIASSLDAANSHRNSAEISFGQALAETGDFQGSIIAYMKIFQNDSIDPFMKNQLNRALGDSWNRLGDYDEAIKQYENFFVHRMEIEGYRKDVDIARNFLAWSRMLREKRSYEEARINARKALSLISFENEPEEWYLGNEMLAFISFEENYWDSLHYYLNSLVSISKNIITTRQGTLLRLKGEYALGTEDLPEAERIFSEANAWYQERNLTRGLCLSRDGLARTLAANGSFSEARNLSRLSLWALTGDLSDTLTGWPLATDVRFMPEAIKGMNTTLRIIRDKALAELELNEMQAGIDLALMFAEWMQVFRQRMFVESGRFQLGKDALPMYEKGLELAYRLQAHGQSVSLKDLLTLFEAAQAGTLTDQVLKAQSGTLPPADTLRQQMLRHRHWRLHYEDKLFRAPDTVDQADIDKWEELAMEHRLGEQNMLSQFPPDPIFSLSGRSQPDVLQRRMRHDNGIWISYFWGNEAIYVLALSGSDMDFRRISLADGLADKIAAFDAMVRDGVAVGERGYAPETIQRYAELSHQLYNSLLTPSLAALRSWRTKRLCIAPSGPLWNLPFAALATEYISAPTSYAEIPYLLYDLAVSQQFSAAIFLQESKELEFKQATWAGFAPYFATNVPSEYDLTLTPLEASDDELLRLEPLLNGEAFIGETSNKGRFLELAPQYDILHMAMHATLEPEDPGFAALVLQGEGEIPGYLSAYEISDLDLMADMAVLSACNTATGPLQIGEGTMSLGRAFRQAGVPRLVMSLWPISDQWTADLMEGFYQEMIDGETVDQALRNSIRASLEANPGTHPHNWAPYVYAGPVGDGDSLPWGWLLGAVSLIVAIIFMRQRRI